MKHLTIHWPRTESRRSAGRARSRSGRSRRSWLLFLLLAMGILVVLAPTIISRTGLRNQIVTLVLGDYPGVVTIGKARAGWFTPIVVEDLTISDVNGQPMAEVARISTSKSLLAFAMHPDQLGKIMVDQPRLQIELFDSTSNVEQAIEAFATSTSRSDDTDRSSTAGASLEIRDGLIGVHDRKTGQSWRVSHLHLETDLPTDLAKPITAELQAQTRDAVATQQSLEGQLTWHRPNRITARDLGRGEFHLVAGGFPLPLLQPLVRRGLIDIELAGGLQVDIRGNWSQDAEAPVGKVMGSLSLVNLDLAAPRWLGSDHVITRQTKADLHVTLRDTGIDIQQCQLVSDLGQLTVSGRFPLMELMTSPSVPLALASNDAYEVHAEGQLDIGRLVAMLPDTLRLREGMEMTGGQLQVTCDSRPGSGQRLFSATVVTRGLSAISKGQVVTWEEPLRIELRAHASTEGMIMDHLICQADFMKIDAAGRVESGRLEGTADLAALKEKLAQFVDLGPLELAGTCKADLVWKCTERDQAEASGTLELSDFLIGSPTWRHSWQEDELIVSGEAQGTLDGQRLTRITTGQIGIQAGNDQWVTTLLSPVERPSTDSEWLLRCRLQGNLLRWADRLRPWVTLPDYSIAGQVDATSRIKASPTLVVIEQMNAELSDLRVDGPKLHLVEPTVRVNGQAEWNFRQQRLTAPDLTLTSGTLSLRAAQLDVRLAPEGLAATGSLAYRADLQRLEAVTRDPRHVEKSRTRGQLNGNVRMTSQSGVSQFVVHATVQDFAYDTANGIPGPPMSGQRISAPDWKTVWSEPQWSIDARGQFDREEDLLTLDQLQLSGGTLALATAGQLRGVTGEPVVALTGTLDYDWRDITRRLGPMLGPQIRLVGRHRYPFTIQGPLTTADVHVDNQRLAMRGDLVRLDGVDRTTPVVSDDLTADATAGWNAAEFYGLKLGPLQVAARLYRGVLNFEPLRISLGEGQVRLAPRLHVNSHPMMLVLDSGTIVDRVRVSPELCRTWLKYVAPLVANASSADGTFSVAINGAQIPVSLPRSSSVEGRLTVHGAQVRPGPLAQQLMTMTDEISRLLDKRLVADEYLQPQQTWLQLKPQEIDFQMTEGRVFHRGLEVVAGDIAIRTQGWVTMDEQMSLVAEIPVQDDWIVKNERLFSALRGQTIRIPVTGSVTQPKLDGSAVTQLTEQVVRGAASSLIQDEMQKQLKKLFGQ